MRTGRTDIYKEKRKHTVRKNNKTLMMTKNMLNMYILIKLWHNIIDWRPCVKEWKLFYYIHHHGHLISGARKHHATNQSERTIVYKILLQATVTEILHLSLRKPYKLVTHFIFESLLINVNKKFVLPLTPLPWTRLGEVTVCLLVELDTLSGQQRLWVWNMSGFWASSLWIGYASM